MRKVFWLLGAMAFIAFFLVTIPFGFVAYLIASGFMRGWELVNELDEWVEAEAAR